MSNKRIFVLVEGDDDERFIDTVKHKIFLPNEYAVQIYKYAEKTQKDVCRFVNALSRMNIDYIFIRDLDDEACITRRKERVIQKYSALSIDRVQIVKREVEGWYLAGLDNRSLRDIGIEKLDNTEVITKEGFLRVIPKKFRSKIDFLGEVRKHFSVHTAIRNNSSFGYFVRKFS